MTFLVAAKVGYLEYKRRRWEGREFIIPKREAEKHKSEKETDNLI